MRQPIVGHDPGLIKALEKAGVLPGNCRRVIIDIAFDSLVTIYFETVADERLLDVDLATHLKIIKTDDTLYKNLKQAQEKENAG